MKYPPQIQSPSQCLSEDGDSHMGDTTSQQSYSHTSDQMSHAPSPDINHQFSNCFINPNGIIQHRGKIYENFQEK